MYLRPQTADQKSFFPAKLAVNNMKTHCQNTQVQDTTKIYIPLSK